MPIATGTVVKRVKQPSKSDSTRERRAKVQKEEEEQELPSLFDIKESKYHDDILNRDSRNK